MRARAGRASDEVLSRLIVDTHHTVMLSLYPLPRLSRAILRHRADAPPIRPPYVVPFACVRDVCASAMFHLSKCSAVRVCVWRNVSMETACRDMYNNQEHTIRPSISEAGFMA
jgi:hypothetical protein